MIFHAKPSSGRRSARIYALLSAILLIALSGCAPNRGIVEFSAYRDSYVEAATAGEQVLDELAGAERALYAIAYPFDPKKSEFDPALAAYYVDGGDPPATASYRRVMAAVTAYNDALYGLASGQDAAAVAGRVGRLAALGAGASAELVGGAALSVAATQSVNVAVAALAPLTAELGRIVSGARFRARLLEEAPTIRAAIDAARASTPRVFNALRDSVVTRVQDDQARFGQLNAEEIAGITRMRDLMANWVILLDAARAALDVAADAAAKGGSFEGMLTTGEALTEAAAAARRNLSAAR